MVYQDRFGDHLSLAYCGIVYKTVALESLCGIAHYNLVFQMSLIELSVSVIVNICIENSVIAFD